MKQLKNNKKTWKAQGVQIAAHNEHQAIQLYIDHMVTKGGYKKN